MVTSKQTGGGYSDCKSLQAGNTQCLEGFRCKLIQLTLSKGSVSCRVVSMMPVVLSGGPVSLGPSTLKCPSCVQRDAPILCCCSLCLVRSAPSCSPSTAELSMQHMESSSGAKVCAVMLRSTPSESVSPHLAFMSVTSSLLFLCFLFPWSLPGGGCLWALCLGQK